MNTHFLIDDPTLAAYIICCRL